MFSSRKPERATWDCVTFRYIAGGEHPDHDTIATFRRRFLKDIEKLFVDVLRLAREMGVLKMGTIGLGQKQQDLGQRVDDPPRLTVVFEPGRMLQQQCYALRSGDIRKLFRRLDFARCGPATPSSSP